MTGPHLPRWKRMTQELSHLRPTLRAFPALPFRPERDGDRRGRLNWWRDADMGSQVCKGRRRWKLGGGGLQPQVVLQDLEGYIKEVPSPSRSFRVCVCRGGQGRAGGQSMAAAQGHSP